VSVLDLTEEFCRTGEMLTARCGLEPAVDFCPGDALAMPFDAGSFDVVWTQHSSMNVPGKERMYAEMARVLRQGGRLALHEIVAGEVAPPHFPVPWASTPELSFLRDAASVRALIAGAGFRERAWRDVTAEALAFVRVRVQALHAGPRSPLGLHVLFGERALPCFENVERNLVERRIAVVAAVFERAHRARRTARRSRLRAQTRPAREAAREVEEVRVALRREQLARGGRARAARAVDQRALAVARQLVHPRLERVDRDQHGARDDPARGFFGRAHVDDADVAALDDPQAIGRRDLGPQPPLEHLIARQRSTRCENGEQLSRRLDLALRRLGRLVRAPARVALDRVEPRLRGGRLRERDQRDGEGEERGCEGGGQHGGARTSLPPTRPRAQSHTVNSPASLSPFALAAAGSRKQDWPLTTDPPAT
jgi:SAM-dependent methyltransferase